MSTATRTIESKILGKKMNIAVYCPDGYENTELPILYFLHGRTGDESILRQLEIDKTADEMIRSGKMKPLMIVCPNMDNSRGINSSQAYCEVDGKYGKVQKGRYEDYFVQEVIPFVDDNFVTVKNRKARFIGGISAGGYSALHIGLRHSDMFSKIGGHMPAIDLSYADEDECYFSDEAMWKKYDPITIAANKNFDGISVFLDAGNNDEGQFYRACEKLYPILKSKGVDIQNHIFDGHHNGKYIMSNMKSYLRFYGA